MLWYACRSPALLWAYSRAAVWLSGRGCRLLDTQLFLQGDELDTLVGYVGAYAGAGIGIALAFFMLGYVVWFIIDVLRGGI